MDYLAKTQRQHPPVPIFCFPNHYQLVNLVFLEDFGVLFSLIEFKIAACVSRNTFFDSAMARCNSGSVCVSSVSMGKAEIAESNRYPTGAILIQFVKGNSILCRTNA